MSSRFPEIPADAKSCACLLLDDAVDGNLAALVLHGDRETDAVELCGPGTPVDPPALGDIVRAETGNRDGEARVAGSRELGPFGLAAHLGQYAAVLREQFECDEAEGGDADDRRDHGIATLAAGSQWIIPFGGPGGATVPIFSFNSSVMLFASCALRITRGVSSTRSSVRSS